MQAEGDNMMGSTLKHRICWLLAPLLLFAPLLWLNPIAFNGNTDSVFYMNVLALVSDAVKSGTFFPRWFFDANNGIGSPVMLFYAPLGYLLTALINLPFAPLGASLETQFLVGIYVSQVCCGLTAWAWLRRSFPPGIAFAGSLVYVLLPYKFISVYEHINLAQLWALAFLPLWMLAAQNMLRGGFRPVGLYALSLAAVYYTHPLTVIAFGAVPALYVLWLAIKQSRGAAIVKLLLAHLLGTLICLAHGVPQQHYMAFIHPEAFFGGRLDWHENLYHIDTLFCAYYLLAMAVGCCIALRTAKGRTLGRESTFWVAVLVVFFFLLLPVSGFIWEHVRLLQYLQFPAARLHAAALIAVVWLTCAWLKEYDGVGSLAPAAFNKRAILVLALAMTGVILTHVTKLYSAPGDLTASYVRDAHAAHIIPAPEYRTAWDCGDPHEALTQYQPHQPQPDVMIASGKTGLIVFRQSPPDRMRLDVNVVSDEAVLTLRQCYFPAWAAHEVSGAVVALSPATRGGLINMTLPTGDHHITLAIEDAPHEKMARMGAIASLCLCALLLIMGRSSTKTDEFA